MITDLIVGDIFQSERRHIGFAVNANGSNDSGFAGLVARRYLPQLVHTGSNKMGDVIEFTAQGLTFHALVCHWIGAGGWLSTPEAVGQALSCIDLPEGEILACVLMGSGFVGMRDGSDLLAILAALHHTKIPIEVYTLGEIEGCNEALLKEHGLDTLPVGVKALLNS